MKYLKRAFTLIELLVVIAIIAILAAILFPVFAQAKAAAKKAASTSNAKQIGLSTIMYSNDYDDMTVPATQWGAGQYYLYFSQPCGQWATWSYLTLPYQKTGAIDEDPQISPNVPGSPGGWWPLGSNWDTDATEAYWPEYGYNYEQLSPWVYAPTNPLFTSCGISYTTNGISATSIGQPSRVVLAAASSAWTGSSPFWYGYNGPMSFDVIEAPYCSAGEEDFDGTGYCMGGGGQGSWGAGSYVAGTLSNNPVSGAYTGNISLRTANNAVVQFEDGHAKAMQPGALAAGTNWYSGINSADVKVTNPSAYIWTNN